MGFWDLRGWLWPKSASLGRPFVSPVGDELDRFIGNNLKARGLNAATIGKSACLGFADRPRLQPMRLFVGKGVQPYFEVRAFWIPFALQYSRCEASDQRDRRLHILDDVGPLRLAFKELQDAIAEVAKTKLRSHGKIWEKSPFEPRNPPYKVEMAIEGMLEALRDRASEVGGPFALLESISKEDTGFDLHGNKAMMSTAFVGILAMAFVRLTGKAPREADRRFEEFLTIIADLLANQLGSDEVRELSKLDVARKNITGSAVPMTTDEQMKWLACNAEGTWNHIIDMSPYNDKQKNMLRHVLCEENMADSSALRKIDEAYFDAACLLNSDFDPNESRAEVYNMFRTACAIVPE